MRKKSRRLFVPAYSSFHRFVFQLSFFCLFGRLVSCPSVCETFFSFQTPLSSITRQQLNDTAVTTAYKTRRRREVDEKSAVGKREVTDSKGNPTTQLVSGDFFFFFAFNRSERILRSAKFLRVFFLTDCLFVQQLVIFFASS